jgi:hypothetical protein
MLLEEFSRETRIVEELKAVKSIRIKGTRLRLKTSFEPAFISSGSGSRQFSNDGQLWAAMLKRSDRSLSSYLKRLIDKFSSELKNSVTIKRSIVYFLSER